MYQLASDQPGSLAAQHSPAGVLAALAYCVLGATSDVTEFIEPGCCLREDLAQPVILGNPPAAGNLRGEEIRRVLANYRLDSVRVLPHVSFSVRPDV
ncbi:hypothetical protein PWY87_16175 [Kribbella solani]|uniref:hypothetical protein n=1 Tax=Kribbella solani TaxID=236067 RepID=UPI0029BA90FC|nr:hypothetical protein [Kribbella solani]MDX3003228.1 hypothetical protein [Kribbella solani]